MQSSLAEKPPFRPLLLALLALLLYLLPPLLLGRHGYVLIHDSLDGEFSTLYLLARQHLAFSFDSAAVLPQVMNGLPRTALRTGLNLTVAVFGLLPDHPLTAYWLHAGLVRTAGLLAMYWLLRGYGLARPGQRGAAAAVALAWAVLPIYSVYGLTVLGQPALLRAALDWRWGRGRGWAAAVCAAFPFWSVFALVGPFVLLTWGAALVLDWARRGRAATSGVLRGATGLAVLGLGYGLVEWPLVQSLLTQQFVPHRTAFDLARLAPHGVGAGLREALRYFGLGQYHASLFLRAVPLLAVGLAWALAAPARRVRLAGRVGGALAGLAAVALFCGFAPQLTVLYKKQLPLLAAFNLNRFHFLTALAWFGVLVLALRELPATPAGRRLTYGLLALQMVLALLFDAEYANNLRTLAGRPRPDAPSYAAYVAPGLLGQVRDFLRQRTGQPPAAYRVLSLGLPPAVAQLNDFYTLDSYQSLYPLAYKLAFRQIIAGELAKSPVLAAYFDAWGNRCYLQAAELGRSDAFGKRPPRTVQHLAFDAAAFRRLGGRYVLSAVRLAHPAESGLGLLRVFDDPEAYWRLYLYEAAPGP